MLFEHAPRALAHGTGGGDEGHFPKHEHLATHDAGHGEPLHDAQRKNHDEDAAVRDGIAEKTFHGGPFRILRPQPSGIERILHTIIQRGDEDHDEKDARDGLKYLGSSHHEGVHFPSSIATDHAVERADDEAEEGPGHADAKRDTRSTEQAVKEVLAVQIGAEHMPGALRWEELRITRRFECLRHEHRPHESGESKKAKRVEREHRRTISPQQSPAIGAGDLGWGASHAV